MYRTASPYIKELLKGEINWKTFSTKTLKEAIAEDKIILLHIGNIANINNRINAINLFKNRKVAEIVNKHFIAIAIDTEDVPEAFLVGMDLLLINEQKISEFINIFSLPGIRPFTSFSSLNPDDFITICKNIIESYKNKRDKLELAAEYLTKRLKFSGVVNKKEAPKNITPKLLHAYIKGWSTRFLDKENRDRRVPYSVAMRNIIFILEYANRYKVKEYLKYTEESLRHLYYSAMFDPIDGGIFREASDYTFKKPLYEKNLYENAMALIAFTIAHKYLKKRIFREAAERIATFLQEQMKSERGYITYITLNVTPNESTYYKYSLKELKQAFPQRYREIAKALRMSTTENSYTQQIISNTNNYWDITPDEIAILKEIRLKKRKEIIKDKRVMTGYNCRTAAALCELAKYSKKGEKEEYLTLVKEIIDNIIHSQKSGKIYLYKYITSRDLEYSKSDLYDYSLFLNALIKYYLLTKDESYREVGRTYLDYVLTYYFQPDKGMFSKTAKYEPEFPVKRAPVIDYNTMCSNSIMADNLLLLYKITGKETYINTFKQQLYNIEPQLIGSGPFMCSWGLQLLYYLTQHSSLPPEE